MCVCVCVCVCVCDIHICMCTYVYATIDTRSQCWVSSSIAVSLFYWQGLSLNLELTVSPRLASQTTARIHLSPPHCCVSDKTGFYVDSGNFMYPLSHIPKYFLICILTASLIHWFLRIVLYNFYLMVSFLIFFLLMISTFIPLWLESILYIISFLFKFCEAEFLSSPKWFSTSSIVSKYYVKWFSFLFSFFPTFLSFFLPFFLSFYVCTYVCMYLSNLFMFICMHTYYSMTCIGSEGNWQEAVVSFQHVGSGESNSGPQAW
jgi:hypothetical protein